MGRIVVVRHGQASIHRSDYDQLSTRGEQQSEALGRYWSAPAFVPDAVFVGPAKRHAQTHAAVTAILDEAGVQWPAPRVLDGLDEHDAFGLVREALAESAARPAPSSELAALERGLAQATSAAERSRAFQRLFEEVMRGWLAGTICPEGIESWPEFSARVQEATGMLAEACHGGRCVVAFSSVGPVAAMLHHALGCTALRAFEVGWRLRNTGLSTFVAGRGTPTLDGFNALPHLPDAADHTYR